MTAQCGHLSEIPLCGTLQLQPHIGVAEAAGEGTPALFVAGPAALESPRLSAEGRLAVPTFRAASDLDMHYRVDDFTDPWRTPETILMLHGNAESGAAWYAWVPHLARHYRIVRPDMRGFGASTPMPADFPWTLDILIDDFLRLLDHLGIGRFHLLGAKIGGTIARAFAARRPERVATLTVVGTPPPFRHGAAERAPELAVEFRTLGVEHWARRTMAGRLGSAFPAEGVEWWIRFMGRTAVSTQIGFMGTIACADIRADLPDIRCPTLVVTTEHSDLASVEETRAWQRQIANSDLLVLPGDSYHVAASHAERCAAATLDFIARSGGN
jgi:3-oxoadipate enol-lactonase